jgi:hypothetical protein
VRKLYSLNFGKFNPEGSWRGSYFRRPRSLFFLTMTPSGDESMISSTASVFWDGGFLFLARVWECCEFFVFSGLCGGKFNFCKKATYKT